MLVVLVSWIQIKGETNTGRNTDKSNEDKAENKNEMSLEIKSQQPSSNDEDPGYASVEEIPLDSPGKKTKLLICVSVDFQVMSYWSCLYSL